MSTAPSRRPIARSAIRPWADLTATQRGKLLYRLGDLVAEHAGRLAELETRDTGKIIRETRAQIGYVADYYRYFGGLADKVEGAHLPIDKPDMEVYPAPRADRRRRRHRAVELAALPLRRQARARRWRPAARWS